VATDTSTTWRDGTTPTGPVPDAVAPERKPRETMRGLPRFVQYYLTWVTGVPLEGDQPMFKWTPMKALVLGIVQIAGGIALGAYALSAFAAWWSIPLLVLSWLLSAGGMRRLDVVVVHQTLHRMFAKTPRGNRVAGEIITTLMWRVPYDKNREEHLIHHAFPCSMKDQDTRYLLSTGMRPGMSVPEYRRYMAKALFSPKHHWGFFSSRLKSQFMREAPRYRHVMSATFAAAMLAFLALTGTWTAWLLLWVVPVSFFFQNATFLYTHTEHRWWIFSNAEKLTRRQRDQLTFGRFVGEPAPDVTGLGRAARVWAWTKWWTRMVFVHSPYRMFVLVGDTVQHDLHHVRPTCDWANSAYERSADIAAGSDRYTEVWGSLVDHLYAAGQVEVPESRRPLAAAAGRSKG
jgi:fatty acid desaturase